jgi:hypothetical protein
LADYEFMTTFQMRILNWSSWAAVSKPDITQFQTSTCNSKMCRPWGFSWLWVWRLLIFYFVTPYNLVHIYRHSGGTCFLHFRPWVCCVSQKTEGGCSRLF